MVVNSQNQKKVRSILRYLSLFPIALSNMWNCYCHVVWPKLRWLHFNSDGPRDTWVLLTLHGIVQSFQRSKFFFCLIFCLLLWEIYFLLKWSTTPSSAIILQKLIFFLENENSCILEHWFAIAWSEVFVM